MGTPLERRVSLPSEPAKSHDEPAQIDERINAIMRAPSYVQADCDTAFLRDDATRGVRLQLDYLKTEEIFRASSIERTIVVFGSTRLREPATARAERDAARRDAHDDPGNAAFRQTLCVAEHRVDLSRYYDIGRELGRLVGQAGDPGLAVMTGGGPGGMEAANRGAFDTGAKSIGLNISLSREQYPNPYLTPGLCMQFHYFAMRKLHFMKRAVALVALPGGFGTMDELFCALTLIQTRANAAIPVVLIGQAYWRKVFDADFLVESGSIDEADRDLFWYAESAQQTWTSILAWHRRNGGPLSGLAETIEDRS